MSSWKHKYLSSQSAIADLLEYFDYAQRELCKLRLLATKLREVIVPNIEYVWVAGVSREHSVAVGYSVESAVRSYIDNIMLPEIYDKSTLRGYELRRYSDERYEASFWCAPPDYMLSGEAPDDSDFYKIILYVERVPFGTNFYRGVR